MDATSPGATGAPGTTQLQPPTDLSSGTSDLRTPSSDDAAGAPLMEPQFAFTYQRPDGNRWIPGSTRLSDLPTTDIQLDEPVRWVLGAPLGTGSVWVAVLDSGRTMAFAVENGNAREIPIEPALLEPGMPPLLKVAQGVPSLVVSPSSGRSPYTHAVEWEPHALAAIMQNGALMLLHAETNVEVELGINALPDARILYDPSGHLLLLTDPTPLYGHGVLGDGLEAASFSLIDTSDLGKSTLRVPIAAPQVIEGIAPIWADLNGDTTLEIIVTLSDEIQGAQIVVFDESGNRIAASEPIGRGYRWRHQIAVAPLGPNGEIELVSVRTPHLGRIVEYFQLEDSRLQLVAEAQGFTSHTIGSRNLDMAAVGDFDSDGRLELLIPNVDLTELNAIQRTANGAQQIWSIPIDGRMSSNLAAAVHPDGQIVVGLGTASGTLRIWTPRADS